MAHDVPPADGATEIWGTEDWFEKLFGFNEKRFNYADVQAQFEIEGTTLKSKANGRRFEAGSFRSVTLGALRKEAGALVAKAALAKGAKTPAKANTPTGAKTPNGDGGSPALKVRHIVTQDAVADHADPGNRGALFQVASQFNCLEFPSSRRTPDDGIQGYATDRTQGPSCAMACAPAAIFRNYFVQLPPLEGCAEPPRRGQTAEMQQNTLAGIEAVLGNGDKVDQEGRGRYFWLKNGYVFSDSERLELLGARLRDMGETGRDELRAALQVGCARGSEVVLKACINLKKRGYVPLARYQADHAAPDSGHSAGPSPDVVSQVFCAAANVVSSDASVDDWEPFARLLLEAAYEATLWAAVVNMQRATAEAAELGSSPPAGCHRVVLTLVGGGVFGNKREWISDAVNRAIEVLAAKAPPGGWGLEVCIAHYQKISPVFEESIVNPSSLSPSSKASPLLFRNPMKARTAPA